MSENPGAVARLNLDVTRQVTDLPPGPVSLWMAVFSDDQRLLGTAPITMPPLWVWRDGRLNVDYGAVNVILDRPGRYAAGYVVAVSGQAWRPVCRISLTSPGETVPELRAGDDVTVTGDTLLRLDFGGGPNDPLLPP